MKERPILFSGPMVRALLDGSKTQTRRIVKGMALEWLGEAVGFTPEFVAARENGFSPYGFAGDRLWVRETWRGVVAINPPGKSTELAVARYVPDQQHCRRVEFQATQPHNSEPWRPSIHMPRWASRITLEVTGVRVERLQDISEGDARNEGAVHAPLLPMGWKKSGCDPQDAAMRSRFAVLWDSLAAPGTDWDANPWVWVVEFKRLIA